MHARSETHTRETQRHVPQDSKRELEGVKREDWREGGYKRERASARERESERVGV